MPRRATPVKREVLPDAKFGSQALSRFINKIMIKGKKSVAERIVYDALTIVQTQTRKQPLEVFEQALRNASPLLQVRPRRVGGATYQVPTEVRPDKAATTATRWLLQSSRARAGKSMAEKLAAELIDASQGQGATIKKREDTHRMAEANRAFAHYRW